MIKVEGNEVILKGGVIDLSAELTLIIRAIRERLLEDTNYDEEFADGIIKIVGRVAYGVAEKDPMKEAEIIWGKE